MTMPSIYGGEQMGGAQAQQMMTANSYIDPETGKQPGYGSTPEESLKNWRPEGYPKMGPYEPQEQQMPMWFLKLLMDMGY